MKNMIFLFVFGAAAMSMAADGGSIGVATPATPPVKVTPHLTKIGLDTFLDFPDGRQAGFYQRIGTVVRTRVGMRQTENTCDYAQVLSNCYLELDIASKEISVTWTKHSDPTKIGQVVQSFLRQTDGTVTMGSPLQEDGDLFWYDTFRDPTYASKVHADRLVCDSLVWAQNIVRTNNQITIDSWSAEGMFISNETNVNENQSLSNVYDVTLRQIDDKTLEFVHFGPAKAFVGLPPYISQQTASLTFIDSQNRECQVSFEASVDEVTAAISKTSFRTKDPTTLSPLRNASALLNSGTLFFLKNAMDPKSDTELQ